jgi:hypothetical protein
MSVTLGAVTYDLQTMLPQPRPPRPRWVIPVVAVLAVLVLALGGLVVVVLAGRGGGATAEPTASMPSTFTLNGQLHLVGTFHPDWSPGADCTGAGGYDDIQGGTSVTVSDASGRLLSVGQLTNGTAVDQADCSFSFSIADVPRGRGPYKLEVAHRGAVPYTEVQLAGQVIRVDLGHRPGAG